MRYRKCPRCKNEWSKEGQDGSLWQKRCQSCNFIYRFKWEVIDWYYPIDLHHFLEWDINRQVCLYANVIDEDKENKLPWLSFDISPEQLKLYLVFG